MFNKVLRIIDNRKLDDPASLVREAERSGEAVHANQLRACGDDYLFAKAVLLADRLGVEVKGNVPGWVHYYENEAS